MNTQFNAIVTDRDLHRNIPHEFVVAPGTTQIAIDFKYAPQWVGPYQNLLTLTVFGPDNFRGAGHRSETTQQIIIGVNESTPGFLTGPIVPGLWNIIIDVHMALPGEPIQYTIAVSSRDTPVTVAPPAGPLPAVAARGAGWYRGNLHSHTIHSDGSWDIPDLLAWAKSEQLDFITLSDHNTISGLPQFLSNDSAQLLTMGGMELTTFYGHALALGIHHWLDWRIADQYSIRDIQRAIEDQHGQFIIAHPKSPGGAICTGCAWEYPDMMPGTAHIVEIWNSGWRGDRHNEEALQLWYHWLKQGHHLVATAGNDIHHLPTKPVHYGFSVVYAETLTEVAILIGIARGHVYVSDGKARLSFSATVEGQQVAIMGDTLPISASTVPQLTAQVDDGDAADTLRLIVNGAIHAEADTHNSDGSAATYRWTAVPGWEWALIEVRAPDGELRAVSNPIYLEWV
jgi:hypothetical protein